MLVKWIPNLLTISRGGLAVLVLLACIKVTYAQGCESTDLTKEDCDSLAVMWGRLALLAFISGMITDYLDGWTARVLQAESRFGVWLDPIADKILVAAALAGLSVTYQAWAIVVPATVIISRDIFITGFRMTPAGKSVVQVSAFAKHKTALEMVAITLLMLPLAWMTPTGASIPSDLADYLIGILFVLPLWCASIMSVVSVVQYLNRAFRGADKA